MLQGYSTYRAMVTEPMRELCITDETGYHRVPFSSTVATVTVHQWYSAELQ